MDTLTNLFNNSNSDKEETENIFDSDDEITENISIPNVFSDDSLKNKIEEENIMMRLLKDIHESTEAILNSEIDNDPNVTKNYINEVTEKNNKKIEDMYNKEKVIIKKNEKIKYTLIALNTVFILGGLGLFFYNVKSSEQQTKDLLKNLEGYSFKAEKLKGFGRSDSWVFKSQSRHIRNSFKLTPDFVVKRVSNN